MKGNDRQRRILIAGIGNIFMGDDAFGVHVAQRLAIRKQPEGVRVVDFGIRGLDLAYALSDGYDCVILVDAVHRGEPPGTLYTIEPDIRRPGATDEPEELPDAHGMDPVKVLQMAGHLGALPSRVLLVGCEPGELPGSEGRMGLSPAVESVLDEAVRLVEKLIRELKFEPEPERILKTI